MIITTLRGARRYLLDHWRGNHSLPRSIIVNTFLPNILVSIVDAIASMALGETPDNSLLIPYLSILIVLTSVVAIWQAVGIWRAARRVQNVKGINIGVLLALLYAPMMLLYVFWKVGELAEIDYRLIEISFNLDRELSQYDVALLSEYEISLDGGITDRSVSAVEKILSESNGIELFHLTSIGGYVVAAESLAQLIKQHNLETYVPWECSSACVTAFLAAEIRSIGLDGYMGMHSTDCPGGSLSRKECDELRNEEAKYFRSRGVADWFIEKVQATSPKSVWEPTFQELADASVITHIFDGEKNIAASEYCVSNDCKNLPVFSIE
jgi:hypothetical protein